MDIPYSVNCLSVAVQSNTVNLIQLPGKTLLRCPVIGGVGRQTLLTLHCWTMLLVFTFLLKQSLFHYFLYL